MGHRPLTGYHVFAFTIPLLILHFPFVWASIGRSPASCGRSAPSSRSPSSGTTSGSSSTPPTPWPGSSAATSGGSRSRGSGASRSTTTSASGSRSARRRSRRSSTATRAAPARQLWLLAGLRGADRHHGASRAAVPALVPAHAPRGRRRPATTSAPTRRRSRTQPGRGAYPTSRRSMVAMDERFKRSEFAIRLCSVDDLFEPFDARPIANRPLNYDARMSLLDQWELLARQRPAVADALPARERARADRRGRRPGGDQRRPDARLRTPARRRPADPLRPDRRLDRDRAAVRLHHRLDRDRPGDRRDRPPGRLAGDPPARLGRALGPGRAPGDRRSFPTSSTGAGSPSSRTSTSASPGAERSGEGGATTAARPSPRSRPRGRRARTWSAARRSRAGRPCAPAGRRGCAGAGPTG